MKPRAIIAIFLLVISQSIYSQEGKRLTILHTNDFHSHLQGFGPESDYTPCIADDDHTMGGLARIAGIIEATKAGSDVPVLMVDGGDCLMGTLFHALEPETGFQLPLMKEAGYDVVAVGNHDFDFGPAAYAEIIRKSAGKGEIPVMLSGNSVTDPDDPGDDAFEAVIRDGLIRRYATIERDGIKIGLFSLLGKDADESAPYAPPVTFQKIIKAGKKLVKDLKSENCDIIICLSHSGVSKDKKGNWDGEDVKLANKVKGIDIIISGHTHTLLKEPLVVKGIPIVQTGSAGAYVGKAEVTVTDEGLVLDSYKLIPVNDAVEADMAIQKEIDEQKLLIDKEILAPLDLEYDMPVAMAPYKMVCDEYGDVAGSNLGELVADAIYYYVNSEGPGTDIAMVAAGVIRDPIQPGIQSVADLFRTMSLGSGNNQIPGYPLSKLWVTGKEVKNIAEILIFLSQSTPSNFCFYSHLKIEYDPDGRLFNKVRKIELTDHDGNVTEVNTSKDDPKLYSIMANSYMIDNLGLIKKKTFGLISVIPKDGNGAPVTDLHTQIADFDTAKPGVQEGKEWFSLVRYLQQFPPPKKGGLPEIPERYDVPDRSMVPVSNNK